MHDAFQVQMKKKTGCAQVMAKPQSCGPRTAAAESLRKNLAQSRSGFRLGLEHGG